MSIGLLMNDVVTLVKNDGTVVKEDLKAHVSNGSIITRDATLTIAPGDHFVRMQPGGLAEDYIVIDPGYMSGVAGAIPPHFQSTVRRSDAPVAAPSTIINNINGPNARVNVKSTDNSTNTNTTITIQPLEVASLIEKIKPHLSSLPEETRTKMQVPIELLESEIRSGNAKSSVLMEGLKSMKAISEGAAGNLVAAGVGAMIGPMLSS